MDWYHYCSTCIFFVQAVDNLGAEYFCMDLQGQVIIYSQTSIIKETLCWTVTLYEVVTNQIPAVCFPLFTVKYLTSVEQSPYPWFQRLFFCYLIPDSSRQRCNSEAQS